MKTGVDFSKYSTYAWKQHPSISDNHPAAEGSPLDKMVRAAGDSVLSRMGLERTDGDADLWVSYTGYVQDHLQVEGIRREITGGVSWIGTPYAHSSRSAQEGTLVFEVIDAESELQVWSGWASEVGKTPEKLRKKAAKATKRILRNFPAQ